MEDKRQNLKSNKQVRLMEKIMLDLADHHPSFYYLSTIEIANEIKNYIDTKNKLSKEDLALLDDLEVRDIQILLSLHNK